MKLKTIDGEQYLDRETKIFYRDDIIPEKFKDATKYEIYIHPFDRPKKNNEKEKEKGEK